MKHRIKVLSTTSALFLLFLFSPSYAQQATSICVQSVPPGNCFPVSATNPLPTTSGGGGGSNVTIAAPLGHGTPDAAAVSVVPSATATFPATQATAASLNATVVGTGTFATQSTDNITQWGTTTLGAPTAVGTEGSGNVITVNAHVTSEPTLAGITPIVSAAGESSHVLKASAGNVFSAYATNLTSTAGFFVILNATSAPADGAITPLACAALSPNGTASFNYAPGPPGIFSTGITAVVSSANTCFTKTTGTITAFISGSVQ